jgi:NAD(P)-dependent dehydrogenase (short-subunit alcohol dehydrogenase family)
MGNKQTIVVTGGASGIGFACAKRAASVYQMNVALCDIDARALAQAAKELERAGAKRVLAMHCDATNQSQVEAFAQQVFAEFQSVDVLFSNVGIGSTSGPGSSYKTPYKQWQRAMDISFMAHPLIVTTFIPRMLKQQPSSKQAPVLVFTSSLAGLMNSLEMTEVPYTIAKSALRMYAESCHYELTPLGLSVHCLCPGFVNTNIVSSSLAILPPVASIEPKARFAREALIAKGMSPHRVAEVLDQAIHKNQFYVVVDEAGTGTPKLLASFARDSADDLEYNRPPLGYLRRIAASSKSKL